MIRRLVVPGSIAALALGAVVSLPAAEAAPRGAACLVSGSATISPGLKAGAAPQNVTIKGVTLSQCRGGNSSAPGFPAPYTATVTVSPTPIKTTASCAKGNLTLTAAIKWSTGKTTNVALSTTGVLANQVLQGRVTSSTDPNIKANDLVAGDVAFRPTTTSQQCTAKNPVTAVTFNGAIGVGSPR